MMWRSGYRRPMWSRRRLWRDMRDLQNDMDFLLGGTLGPMRVSFPPINAWQNDDGIVLTAELPGIDSEDLNISVEGETLTLSGNRQVDEMPEDVEFHRRERSHGEFSRTIQLPFKVDVDSVSAEFTNGVLRVELPRLPEEKPRKIQLHNS